MIENSQGSEKCGRRSGRDAGFAWWARRLARRQQV